MRSSTFFATVLSLVFVLFGSDAAGQTGVLNPDDPIVVYNPAAPPATPAFGTLAKWVKTNRVGFNTTSFKSYFYKGLAFRIKFPKSYQHGVSDGKKYPMFIFFHGIGERGTIYDNEYQLYHGGQLHMDAVDNDKFDGFLLYPQTSSSGGYFSTGQIDVIKELIENYFVPQIKVDINRILLDGLSGGGNSTWTFAMRHPTLIAAALPISSPIGVTAPTNSLQALKFTPIWQFQGGLDANPNPNTTQNIINNYNNAGAQIAYNLYPDQGHGCWYNAWNEADYFPYLVRANKLNPWPLTGRTEFCPGDPINVTMGVTPGFQGYEWRRNGTLIAGATSNQIVVNSIGVYDCRVRRGTTWSEWSPVPCEIKLKTPTVTPPITTAPLTSRVIPALDTTTGVLLRVPAGFESYEWQKTGSNAVIGTQNTFHVKEAGGYRVRVTELYGCSSAFSDVFNVVDANGPNKPTTPVGFSASTVSKTEIRLNWTDVAGAPNNEEQYELYRSSQSAGPYKLIAFVPANTETYLVQALNSNSTYFFKVRGVNAFSASAPSETASANTLADVIAPTAPMNLRITGTTRNSISLLWNASTDDVEVIAYDIFMNGVKAYSTSDTAFTIYNLNQGQNFNIRVRASDFAENFSPFSNQVTAQPLLTGLNYKYYTFTGTWNTLPDFTTLTPVKTGITPNVSLAPATQDDNFAFLWEGFIRIPENGTYTFRTNSDDGSKLYLSTYSFGATALVNNDGLHGPQDRDGTITLAAGVYPIAISFYEQAGGASMNVSWRTPQTGNSFVTIPDSLFADEPLNLGSAPSAPSALAVTATAYNKISLSWTDNSSNETGFEIYRSPMPLSGFNIIGTAPAGATGFIDSTVSAETTYYYRIKAIGQYGESEFDSEGAGIEYAYYEINGMSALPNFAAYTPVRTGRIPVIDLSPRLRNDNFAMRYTGTIHIPTTGTYTFYTASDDGSRLYINGFDPASMVVDNDGLHGTVERSGQINLAAGAHTLTVTFFEQGGGEVLNVYIEGPGMSKQSIPSAMLGEPFANATTPGLPDMPTIPQNVTATGLNFSAIALNWDDVANEVSFIVYRSETLNGNYDSIAILPANTLNYTDSSLSPNALFFYKLKAVNAGGESAFSAADSASVWNRIPVLGNVSNILKRFDEMLEIPVSATDEDNGVINITFEGLPGFASYNSASNGTGTLVFAAGSIADLGTYTVNIIASDLYGGSDTASFDVVINSNHTPQIAPVANVVLSENAELSFSVSASDLDEDDSLEWSFEGLPAFVNPTVNGRTVTLQAAPGFADNGTYNIRVKAVDNAGAADSSIFTITVQDVDPNQTIFVNFGDATYTSGAPWNNTAKTPVSNDFFGSLKDASGNTTNVGVRLLNAWTGINNMGGNTGNNSGVYPDAVMRSSYYTSATPNVRISGLQAGYTYKLTFFPSRANPVSGVGVVTTYTVGSESVTLNAADNTANTVSIGNLTAAADGTITFSVQKAAGSTFGYLNALVIEGAYNDGSAPAAARNVSAAIQGESVALTWTDAAYNEDGYEVYRSTSPTGPFNMIHAADANLNTYSDNNVLGSSTYYYFVRTFNTQGEGLSDTVSVSTPNISPIIATIADVEMLVNETRVINVSAQDTEGDVVTLSASNLPAFASFTDNGDGTGVIEVAPGSTTGIFNNIIVTATDSENASSSTTFVITVAPAEVKMIYINFNQAFPVGGVWNSTNAAPNANLSIANLRDDDNVNTGITMTMLDKWTSAHTLGVVTGSNSGVYPDDVMRTFYYESTANTKRIRLSNLPANHKFKLTFFASRANYTSALSTRYAVGSQSVVLDANNNSSNTVSLTELVPDANGELLVNINRSAGPNAYIGAMVIEYYEETGNENPGGTVPSGLSAIGLSKTSVRVQWTPLADNAATYEVWSAASANGTYSKVADVAAAGNTYQHNGLMAGNTYYYKVRALQGGEFSEFSTVASATTVGYVINLNLNDGTASGLPEGNNWNNLNTLVSSGFVLENMINDQGFNTGINLGITSNFSGYNSLGASTGNNSGIVPDNVMRSFYYCNFGDTARLTITGLSQSHRYNFTFFGSRANPVAGVSVVSIYKIGNETVTLNAANNTANTIQINNVAPDVNGNVLITVYAANQGGFGYLNSLTISGVPGVPQGEPTTVQATSDERPGQIQERLGMATVSGIVNNAVGADEMVIQQPGAFPNPFTDDVTIKFDIKENVANFTVSVVDITGRIVLRKHYSGVHKGPWIQKIGLNGRSLNPGMYYIRISGVKDLENSVIPIMKIR